MFGRKPRVRKVRRRFGLGKQFILIIKELKRVRGPSFRTSSTSFVKIIIFTVVFALFVLAVATAATSIGNAGGVGA